MNVTLPVAYVLDANAFIEAKRRYYAFDLCPGFWDALVWHHGQGAIGSIDRVRDELELGQDDLAHWVQGTVPAAYFASTSSPSVLAVYAQVMVWVQTQQQYSSQAKADFAAGADPWLIAYAKDTGRTLVTQEVLDQLIHRRVPIPNVCEAFGVPYLNTFELLRALQTSFTWLPVV
jgi:hypothetical protein